MAGAGVKVVCANEKACCGVDFLLSWVAWRARRVQLSHQFGVVAEVDWSCWTLDDYGCGCGCDYGGECGGCFHGSVAHSAGGGVESWLDDLSEPGHSVRRPPTLESDGI